MHFEKYVRNLYQKAVDNNIAAIGLTDYFSIDASVPAERKSIVVSRLLTAHAMGKPINIGYDKVGDCSSGRIRVHRVG